MRSTRIDPYRFDGAREDRSVRSPVPALWKLAARASHRIPCILKLTPSLFRLDRPVGTPACVPQAVNGHGNLLSADDTAAIYIPNDTSGSIAQINPGITVTAIVAFQLPVGSTISTFVVHDSAFSGGVTVYNVG
jgi:hypothetical protein